MRRYKDQVNALQEKLMERENELLELKELHETFAPVSN